MNVSLVDILYSVATVAAVCFLGALLANLSLELGIIELLSKPLTPLMRVANLPRVLSIPALISVADVRYGLSVISSIKEKYKID
ncbi:MAG: hypothetical protein NZ992_07530, partial [Candidatus Korarchaeum sp.]|nr:hypothetical protein [Candidatus Korarchaeum sp.]